jgi:hypothetical protein
MQHQPIKIVRLEDARETLNLESTTDDNLEFDLQGI